MESRNKNLIKNTSILTISNFSSKILVFLLVPLYTNILTTEEYGTYDLIMTTIQIFIPFFSFNITDGVLRFSMDKEENQGQVKVVGLKYVTQSAICMVGLLVVNAWLGLWTAIKGLEVYTFIYFVAYVFNQLLVQTTKGQEQVKELGIAGIISTIVTIVSNVLFLIIIPCGLKGFFGAYILGLISSIVYLLIVSGFFQNLPGKIDKELERKMLRYTLPLILGALGWLINNVSDRYIVTWLCGISENGIYSVSYKIPTIISTVQNIFLQAWTISAIKAYKEEDKNSFYQSTFTYVNGIMVLTCSVLILFTKSLAHFLYAKDFYEAWQYVPFLLISVVFSAAAGFIGPILSARFDSKSLANSTLVGAVVNLILNVILIKAIGVQGAAVATAVSNLAIYLYRRLTIGKILFCSSYFKVILSWLILGVQATLMVYNVSLIYQIPFVVIQFILYQKYIKKALVGAGIYNKRK